MQQKQKRTPAATLIISADPHGTKEPTPRSAVLVSLGERPGGAGPPPDPISTALRVAAFPVPRKTIASPENALPPRPLAAPRGSSCAGARSGRSSRSRAVALRSSSLRSLRRQGGRSRSLPPAGARSQASGFVIWWPRSHPVCRCRGLFQSSPRLRGLFTPALRRSPPWRFPGCTGAVLAAGPRCSPHTKPNPTRFRSKPRRADPPHIRPNQSDPSSAAR